MISIVCFLTKFLSLACLRVLVQLLSFVFSELRPSFVPKKKKEKKKCPSLSFQQHLAFYIELLLFMFLHIQNNFSSLILNKHQYLDIIQYFSWTVYKNRIKQYNIHSNSIFYVLLSGEAFHSLQSKKKKVLTSGTNNMILAYDL